MNILRNEKGFVLGFVLILAAIALVMTVAMLFLAGQGSFVSAQQKRYRTAVEASRGGAEAMLQIVGTRGIPTITYTNQFLAALALKAKLDNSTSTWVGLDNSLTIDVNDNTTYDMAFDLGTSPGYRVYAKIVDTVIGNTGGDEGLLKSGVVNTGSGEVIVPNLPYLYTIEVLSQSRTNASDRSKISVLYQY